MDDVSGPRPALLTPAEAAEIFHVVPRTLARWAAAGRLSVIRTPGGHRRYLRDQVIDLASREEVVDLTAVERRAEPRQRTGGAKTARDEPDRP